MVRRRIKDLQSFGRREGFTKSGKGSRKETASQTYIPLEE